MTVVIAKDLEIWRANALQFIHAFLYNNHRNSLSFLDTINQQLEK